MAKPAVRSSIGQQMRPPSRFCLDFREASININDSARRRQGSCVSADLEGITTPLQPSTRTDSVVDHVASRLRGPRHDSGPEGRRREVAKTAKPRDVETIQTSGTSHSSSWEMHRKSDDQTFSSTGNRTSRRRISSTRHLTGRELEVHRTL